MFQQRATAAQGSPAQDERRSCASASSQAVQQKGSQTVSARENNVQGQRLGALAEMSTVIAHDLNNSLTPIIGFSDYLLDASTSLPDEYRKCLQGIRKAAGDIAGMVEQMRQFYRQRDSNERLEPVDLNPLIREVLDSTVAQAPDFLKIDLSRLEVQLCLGKGLPAVEDRAVDLREAFRQLFINALEAMPEGGKLSVKARRLTGGATERIVVEVSDTGVGMDAATRERCLDPFFSTKGPRRRGLGLSLVYGVIRRHDGRIDITSHTGQGTKVRLAFNPRG
jgi:signal transduction histidine kinase